MGQGRQIQQLSRKLPGSILKNLCILTLAPHFVGLTPKTLTHRGVDLTLDHQGAGPTSVRLQHKETIAHILGNTAQNTVSNTTPNAAAAQWLQKAQDCAHNLQRVYFPQGATCSPLELVQPGATEANSSKQLQNTLLQLVTLVYAYTYTISQRVSEAVGPGNVGLRFTKARIRQTCLATSWSLRKKFQQVCLQGYLI